MIDSYPYPGSAACDYNAGWTATVLPRVPREEKQCPEVPGPAWTDRRAVTGDTVAS
jgi:hypothetical protein